MKRKIAILACVLATCSIAGTNISIPVAAQDAEAVEESTEDNAEDMICSNMNISIQTADKIAEAQSGQNIMFSPTSLNFALGMLQGGAESNTE